MTKKPTKATKRRAPGPALADPGDPLVLSDGTAVLPITHEKKREQKERSGKIDPQTFKGKKVHNIKDLPAPVNVFNALGAVLAYSAMGVGDREIADALKCTVLDIEQLRAHPAYLSLFENLFENIISAHSDSLTGRIASYSHGALSKVAFLSDNAQNEAVMLRASTDILDRAGVRPKDLDAKGQLSKNSLRIQITEAGGGSSVTVELNPDM